MHFDAVGRLGSKLEHTLVVVACAVLAGVASGAPYAVGLAVSKKKRDASILPLVGAACVSVVVIALAVLVAYVLVRDDLIVFACALLVAFFVTVVLSVIVYGRKPRP